MKTIFKCALLFVIQVTWSQVTYSTPPNDSFPQKIQNIRRAIDVVHFPKENDPVKIKNKYYWKHATAILCKESDITITEYGAYLYYNNTWNLRKAYPIKELDKLFGTKKQIMLQAEPYIYLKNWRVDSQLFGGWALWYFIGKTKDGETVCGYGKINTTSNLLN